MNTFYHVWSFFAFLSFSYLSFKLISFQITVLFSGIFFPNYRIQHRDRFYISLEDEHLRAGSFFTCNQHSTKIATNKNLTILSVWQYGFLHNSEKYVQLWFKWFGGHDDNYKGEFDHLLLVDHLSSLHLLPDNCRGSKSEAQRGE